MCIPASKGRSKYSTRSTQSLSCTCSSLLPIRIHTYIHCLCVRLILLTYTIIIFVLPCSFENSSHRTGHAYLRSTPFLSLVLLLCCHLPIRFYFYSCMPYSIHILSLLLPLSCSILTSTGCYKNSMNRNPSSETQPTCT